MPRTQRPLTEISPSRRSRLVLTTNIPTPYRVAFFQVLATVAQTRDIEFEVLFYAATEPNRRWVVDLSAQPYRWAILPGLHPAVRGIYPHFNPTLPLVLRRRQPTWILIAGAWNTPSSLMATSRLLSGPGYRVMWSEGHAQAVLHPTGPVARARRACWESFDGFAVPNEASRRFVHSELGRAAPCLRLPNTVDEDYYLAGDSISRNDLRTRLDLASGDFAVLCVAELADRKGVAELAQAAALLPPAMARNTVFVFAGDGPLRAQIASLTPHVRVRMLGHVGPSVVRDWMYSSDLFVLPSKIDPNPLSAIEAAFCGTPLMLSARAGNSADLIGDGQSGWILPHIEPGAIAATLEDAFRTSPDRRRLMGLRGRDVALTQYSRRGVAEQFLDDLLREFPAKSG